MTRVVVFKWLPQCITLFRSNVGNIWEYFYVILPVPRNIVMDLRNLCDGNLVVYGKNEGILFGFDWEIL